MKKLMGSLATKITAIILSFIMIIIFTISAVSVVLMANYNFYTNDYNASKSKVLTGMLKNETYNIHNRYNNTNLKEYFKEKNIYYVITDSKTGETIDTNYNGEKYIASSYQSGMPIYDEYESDDENGETTTEEKQIGEIDIKVYAADKMKFNDKYFYAIKLVDFFYPLKTALIVIGIIALLAFIIILSFLYCAEGHRQDGSIQCNHLDLIPFDLLTVAVIVAAFFSIYAVEQNYGLSLAIIAPIILSFDYFIGLGYTLTFAARIKTKTFLKNNILYKIIMFLAGGIKRAFKGLKYIFSNLSLIKKTILILTGIIFVELILLIGCIYSPEALAFLWFIFTIVMSVIVMYIAITLQKIKNGGERIAHGDLDYKINTDNMYSDFKKFSESLNNISDGLQTAVNEKMKSERFKTELITNVSHDIKTPLTSIINYVDLIKKEKSNNENISKYIEVLDRQSGRLKKLIEDLVEASKASTGNLTVNLSECEVGVLLSQTIGEFDERLKKNNLQPVLKKPEKPIVIMADGRHLWRVFDNLMSNVCKYSQKGTRVYMDVEDKDGKSVITFRNISGYELNITSDELMERFVRGDTSRNTEGSGLGLSIARSLVELQNGIMEINVDGDLFKVILTFDMVRKGNV